MAKDSQTPTVHELGCDHGRGPVLYASMPCSNATGKGCGANSIEAKRRLVSILLDHLAAMKRPLGKRLHPINRTGAPIKLLCGPLGRPFLRLGGNQNPAISFSQGGGKVWAAICGDESDLGIDAAEFDEFQGKYPFHRVFRAKELQQALKLADGNLGKAAALLWSAKEAVVKALGCGFHLVAPRQITICQWAKRVVEEGDAHALRVGLSAQALRQLPMGAGQALWVRSFPQTKGWLSIALLNRHPRADGWSRCFDSSARWGQRLDT